MFVFLQRRLKQPYSQPIQDHLHPLSQLHQPIPVTKETRLARPSARGQGLLTLMDQT
jgi:hypothetical protein